METLVRLGRVEGVDRFLEELSWHDAGIDLDLTDLEEEEYRELREKLGESPVPVRSLHYGRTSNVSLQEWELFESQLELVTERAEKFGCSVVSVAPPKAEIGESHTLRDLQEFMENADSYAEESDLELCFLLDDFLCNPETMNTAFQEIQGASLGVMVDVTRTVDGFDPVDLLEKLDVEVRKLYLPVPVSEVGEHLGEVEGEVMVVADTV
ncbi:MAG: hypothetical protein ABEI07_00335 [Candidatus Nanohaloarchaea archaeon]